MAQYIVGQTYKALINHEIRTFEIVEMGTEEYGGMIAIKWDDGDEEWNWPEELDLCIRTVKDEGGQNAK